MLRQSLAYEKFIRDSHFGKEGVEVGSGRGEVELPHGSEKALDRSTARKLGV